MLLLFSIPLFPLKWDTEKMIKQLIHKGHDNSSWNKIICWLCICGLFYFSHRNVMMRLNLQLTMGSFSLSLFGLIGVAFGMNLTSCFEEVRQLYVIGGV